ncbi:MAG: hypothetical protein JNK05_23740 [Myxococcales bacterium]|nr:hypothetical protein [Myxococcales bacterium]
MDDLDRDRVMNPPRARAREALAAIEGVHDGAEAWERLEARGLVTSGTVGDPKRRFGGWLVSYDHKRTWSAVDQEPTAFSKRQVTAEPAPMTVALAVALACDWANVQTAEALARDAFDALRPWIRPAAAIEPSVTFRFGRGAAPSDRGELWYPRTRLIVCAEREIETAGEIRTATHERPLKSACELTALEDAVLAQWWDDERARVTAQRAERDRRELEAGRKAPGPAVPTDDERWSAWSFGAQFATAPAVVRRFDGHYGGYRTTTPPPHVADARNVFAPLVALWNTGYVPAHFSPEGALLEVAPLEISTMLRTLS